MNSWIERLPPEERKLVEKHQPKYILGVDECGYGAWAGPVTVGGFLVSTEWSHPGLKDSKQLTKKIRARIFQELSGVSWPHYVFSLPSQLIDQMGMKVALRYCYTEVLTHLLADNPENTLIIADGVWDEPLKVRDYPLIAFPKADVKVPAVSAASVMGKVTRDKIMVNLATSYPDYGFQSSMGYGTPDHQEALKEYGPCPIHRMSYAPLRSYSMPPRS